MKFIAPILSVIFSTFCVVLSFSQSQQPLVIGKQITLSSTFLNEERKLNIYLPDNYSDSLSYPCIYLLDGSRNEDFLHIVGLVQFFYLTFGMPETVVVGIENVDRKRDFTFPTELADLKSSYPTTGHSKEFINFLKSEVKPAVEKAVHVSDKSYLIGQSLGGLLATEILLSEPTLFSHYIIVSPSLWWDNKSMLKTADSVLKNQVAKPQFVFVAVGSEEGKIMEGDAKKLASLLKKTKGEHQLVEFKKMKNQNHATVLHLAVYEAFLKLFPFQE